MTTPTSSPADGPALAAGALYCGPNTHLRINVFNAAAGVTLTLTAQRFDPACGVLLTQQAITPSTDRLINTVIVPMGEGWLMPVQLVATVGSPRRGQCYVRVELVNGINTNAQSMTTILQGYVLDTSGLAYPGSPLELSTSGRGVIRSVAGTDPAAGVEISDTVPTNARWRLIAAAFQLVASAAVANRLIVLTLDDGATVFFEAASNVALTASQTGKFRAASGLAFQTFGATSWQLPLPNDCMLPAGARIRTVTAALDAGDNYGAPQYLVEEWIED